MAATVTDLRREADTAAQRALHDMNEYAARHGRRNLLLEKRYELAERVMDAVDEYEASDELVRLEAAEDWTIPRTPDLGDHHVYPVLH